MKEALKKAEQEAEKAAKEGKSKEKSSNDEHSETVKARMPESKNEDGEEQANKRMKAMAAKLNNLVMKFQRKVMASKCVAALAFFWRTTHINLLTIKCFPFSYIYIFRASVPVL